MAAVEMHCVISKLTNTTNMILIMIIILVNVITFLSFHVRIMAFLVEMCHFVKFFQQIIKMQLFLQG